MSLVYDRNLQEFQLFLKGSPVRITKAVISIDPLSQVEMAYHEIQHSLSLVERSVALIDIEDQTHVAGSG